MIKVRFAPSPTGHLHIGGIRTALFNWLFARHHQGTFILRIEDTDKKRSRKKYIDDIIESLRWLRLNWDEGPYFQSKRINIYHEYAEYLVGMGKAEREKKAIIFKIPKQVIEVADIIHGKIKFDTTLFKDMVIIKSDRQPTYNFACVVDDAKMGITHIIRGDDHISNTPKQILLYQALGLELPKFAHVPLILGPDRGRLSKRHGAVNVLTYKKMGFLWEGVVNYLALLGWSPGNDKEIMKIEEIIERFSLQRVGKTSAIFDISKMLWLNGQHMGGISDQDMVELVRFYLKKNKSLDSEKISTMVSLYKQRAKTIVDIINQADFFLKKNIGYEEQAFKNILNKKGVVNILRRLADKLTDLQIFDLETVEIICRGLAEEMGIKFAELAHPVRVALTGKTTSPGLFDIIMLLGKKRTISRLKKAMKSIKK
ncbi:MAG: glutamate--tRNA ligase [Candidatus Omnitrophota bacterium]